MWSWNYDKTIGNSDCRRLIKSTKQMVNWNSSNCKWSEEKINGRRMTDDRRFLSTIRNRRSIRSEQAFHTIAVSAQIYEFEITFWMSGDSDSQENAFDDVCSATQINADLHTFQTNNSFLFLFSVINFDSVLNNAHISLVVRLQFHPRHRLDFSFISDVAFLFSLWTRKSIRNAILVARLSYAFPSISNDDLSRSHFIRSRSSFCSFMDAHQDALFLFRFHLNRFLMSV